MRVLWLAKGLGAGGAERLLLNMARARDRERISYDAAYLLPWKDHLVPELEAAGVTTHLLDGPRALDLRWALRLRRLLASGGFDVVHAHSPAPAALARLVARTLPRRRRPRFVYTEHNVWSSYRFLTRVLGRLTYWLDDARVAVAEEVRTSLPPRLAAHTVTVVHGIDIGAVRTAGNEREAVRAELGVGVDELLVVTLANLRADKDYPNLATAAATVLERVPRARWVVAGQQTTSPDAATLFGRPGLERLVALGHRDDPWRLIGAADVIVIGSRNEGLPVVLMEAVAQGIAVVATTVGGIPSLVRDGVDGRLVPPSDPAALADAVVEVLTDDGARARMAASIASRTDEIDARRAASQLEDLYDTLRR